MSAAAIILDNRRYAARTVESARTLLQDIPECASADYSVRFLGLVPALVLAFNIPETASQPACLVRLTTVSRKDPTGLGNFLEGDRLRRHIRDSVENYLLKHGVRFPTFEGAI